MPSARISQRLRNVPPGAPVADEALVRRACFGALSPYEVALGPRKLVGLSQVRKRAGVLFQVGLPLAWDGDLLAALLAHNADERARLERRRRLVAEVAPYLAPGERVREATTGRGGRPLEPAALRVVLTDQRLIVLRKKAFRQFAVQEFSFDSSRVWLGFTAEAGGELEVSDAAHRTHVSLSGVPELDLEPADRSALGRARA